jgi:predicted metal-dependent enzyme (double-stranded beta helix superfamily)
VQLATTHHQFALSRFPTGRGTQLEALVKTVKGCLSLPVNHADEIPAIVASQLRGFMSANELLNHTQQQPNASGYQRHTLYRDETGQFTILALVWLPGQETPVHGHMAWGAVGLYSGELNVVSYEIFGTRAGQMHLKAVNEIDAREGDVTSVTGGINDIHRIKNTSSKPAISVHVYGMDVAPESAALNILFPQ